MRISPLADLYDGADNNDERQFYADTIRRALRFNADKRDDYYKNKINDWVNAQGWSGGYGKIETIKKVRTEKNWGLKEAKDWVEANIPSFYVKRSVDNTPWLPPVQ